MERIEILRKVITKAVKNSCDMNEYVSIDWLNDLEERETEPLTYEYYDIIFGHAFAKAFFGEENASFCMSDLAGTTISKEIPEWKYHLQLMVISDDPLRYLEGFL
jgi:hypothetical protein